MSPGAEEDAVLRAGNIGGTSLDIGLAYGALYGHQGCGGRDRGDLGCEVLQTQVFFGACAYPFNGGSCLCDCDFVVHGAFIGPLGWASCVPTCCRISGYANCGKVIQAEPSLFIEPLGFVCLHGGMSLL